ncbi:hypothetical protein BDV95DRAFT_18510 [Massariosphaeria phaeospora]|uniref:Uncharacterized protein n=1 Tax=Massariosphaeria phaeospora TaxID=100035 RepID=A0A7C8ME40_9PLEO|nr:hypothetical protein BDV95DRAFT_18510 [Massariosphaeria phaeospora]
MSVYGVRGGNPTDVIPRVFYSRTPSTEQRLSFLCLYRQQVVHTWIFPITIIISHHYGRVDIDIDTVLPSPPTSPSPEPSMCVYIDHIVSVSSPCLFTSTIPSSIPDILKSVQHPVSEPSIHSSTLPLPAQTSAAAHGTRIGTHRRSPGLVPVPVLYYCHPRQRTFHPSSPPTNLPTMTHTTFSKRDDLSWPAKQPRGRELSPQTQPRGSSAAREPWRKIILKAFLYTTGVGFAMYLPAKAWELWWCWKR